jgi:hypothetical protein
MPRNLVESERKTVIWRKKKRAVTGIRNRNCHFE